MPKKYYEGVRAKRMLNLLNVEDNVVKLRHTNAEEYIEVFGSDYQPVENYDCNRSQQSQYRAEAEQEITTKQDESKASNVCHQPPVSDGATSLRTRRQRRAHRRRIIMSDEDEDVENHDGNRSQHSQYGAEAEQELVTKQKLTSKQGASLVSNVCHIRRPLRSKSLSDLSQDYNRLLSLRKTQSTLLLTEGLPLFDVSSMYLVMEEVASKSDDFQTFSVCHIRREVRSWSLSHLTQDSVAFYDRPLKKSKSAPFITEEFSQNSPSLLAGCHRTASSEAENSTPNRAYDPVDSSTDSDVETTEEYYGDLSEGRKRRHVPEPDSWKRNRAKLRRMQGESYLGFSKPRDGKFQQNTPRPAREIGDRYQSDFCKKSKLRACIEVTESIRQNIYQSFWKDMSWEQRKVYVSSLVTRSDTTRKTKSTSRREGTYKYFLPIKKDGSLKVQVCRNMFLNTLSLGSFTVQAWVKKCEFRMTPNNNVEKALKPKPQRPETKRKILTANNFLNWLPKMPSHYARKETSKLYIEPSYHSLVELYNAYKTYCNENEEPQVSRFTFEKIFHEMNLSLYTLKKDMCDVCSAYRAGNLDEADYQIHIIKKERARKEKNEDKVKAAAGQFILLCMDLEAVKVCPYLTASALYFKTKLSCHNFTIYNLITNHCTCYWFTETAADLKASTFATCIIDYIERHCISQKLPIVIYSDGCTYQNRNTILANALLNCSKVNNINIYQKYLEPGHTQMECDSVHSAIERKLKNREIHLPSDYITITKEARKNTPYETVDVGHDFVKDYTAPENIVYKNIRPGRKAGDPQVVDIKVIHYNTMTIEVKLSFDSDWIPLPQRPRVMTSALDYPQLHQNRIPIAETKYRHLQELKTVLPKDCHAFYDSLPYN